MMKSEAVKPSERKWYRSSLTGDRGYMVVRDGKDSILLDQPGHEVVRKFSREWEPEHERPPLSPAQVGLVCYQADAAFCKAMGIRADRFGWEGLSDDERIRWMDRGPKTGTKRRKLYSAIRKILQDPGDD